MRPEGSVRVWAAARAGSRLFQSNSAASLSKFYLSEAGERCGEQAERSRSRGGVWGAGRVAEAGERCGKQAEKQGRGVWSRQSNRNRGGVWGAGREVGPTTRLTQASHPPSFLSKV